MKKPAGEGGGFGIESLMVLSLGSMPLSIIYFLRALIGVSRLSGDRIPQLPAAADGAPRIVVEIRNKDPIDLLDFSAQFTAIAREHEAMMRAENPKVDIDET